MSHKNYHGCALDRSMEVIEDVTEAAVEMIGVVTGCLKLNIYSAPDKVSPIIATAECLDELLIAPETSTDSWYAVCTAAGIEGFCMKKFVAIR